MTDGRRRLIFVLVCFHVLVPLGLLWQHRQETVPYAVRSDAAKFRDMVTAPGKPYVDRKVEYPPLALALFKGLGPRSFTPFFFRLVILQALCDGLIAWLLFRIWSTRAGLSYLALSAPLLPHSLTKFDLVAVALAVGAVACAKKARALGAGVLVGLGVFVKIFPAVLVPVFAARRQWRALATAAAALVLGAVCWFAYSGTDGFRDVLTYRGAKGWHVDSIPGSVLYLFDRRSPRFESGTWRVGAPPAVWSMLFYVSLLATIAIACWLVYRARADADGLLEVTVLSAMLAFATLNSVQFMTWLLPFAAIAGALGARRVEWTTAAVVVLTAVGQAITNPERARPPVLQEAIFGARNIALVVLLVFGIAGLVRVTRREPALVT